MSAHLLRDSLPLPGHVLAFDPREQTIERILPAEAIRSPPFQAWAQRGKTRPERTYIYVTLNRTRWFVLPFAASWFDPAQVP